MAQDQCLEDAIEQICRSIPLPPFRAGSAGHPAEQREGDGGGEAQGKGGLL